MDDAIDTLHKEFLHRWSRARRAGYLCIIVMQSLYASIGVRVVAVAIAIYLVQILVSMYRYYTRVSSHYQTRADMLSVLKAGSTATLSLRQFAEVFALDHIAFGRTANPSAEQALKLASDIVAREAGR